MVPGGEVLKLGRGYISHLNMHNLLVYQCTAHLLLLYISLIMMLSYAIVDFYLFYDGADLQICTLLTSKCRVSDTQPSYIPEQ